MALKDVTNYIKNMGKSVGYSMIDISKETAPAMAEFVDTNKDLFKDVYAAVKDHKRLIEKTKAAITSSKIYEAADLGLKATMEDIRTGNFYNKAREAEFNEKYSGFNMDDIGDDMEFSVKGDDDGSFSTVQISDGDKYVSSTVESAVRASADLTSTTIARSAEYMGKVSKINTNAIIVQNERLFGNLSNRIVAMHGGINDLYKLHATAIEANAKMNNEFFNNTTSLMRESNAMLKEMLEMQRNMYKNEQEKAKQKTTYGDIVGSNGMPDLKEYAKIIKKNFKGATGQFGDMLNMFGNDGNMLATFMASPLQFIPNFIAKAIIPAAVKSNMAELDKSLSGIFGTSIARLNKMAKNEDSPIASFIGKLFGINTSVKGSIDTSNYKKGAVPFDGITRKSIVEVIPGHLRRIESILSGMGDERIYDYDKGKWSTVSSIKSQYEAIGDQYRRNAFSDVRNHANKYTKKAGFSKNQKKKFDEDFELFLRQVYEEGGYLPSNLRKMKRDNYDYNISEDNFEIIRNILTTMNKGDIMQIAGKVLDARNRHNKTITDLEESGSSLYNYLFDGSDMKNTNSSVKYKDGRIVGFGSAVNIATVTDNLGNNVFFYLQNILKNLEWQKLNWIYANGGGSRRRSGSLKDIKDSDWNTLVNHSKSGKYNINSETDIDLSEVQDSLREQAVLAGIKDEDDRRKEYREKGYGRLYSERDDLDFGRYSHGKHHKGIVTRLREAGSLMDKFNVISEGIKDFANKPASVLASVLDKANQSIFSFFYQDPLYDEEGNKIRGFMDLMTSKMKTSFDKFNKFLDEKILDPLKKKLGVDSFGDLADKFLGFFGLDKEGRGRIKESLFGEGTFFGDFKNGFKEEIDRIIKDVATTTKTAVAETYGVGADAVFGTTYSSYGKAKDKDRKKYASQRNSLISYMAQAADFKKRENFGTDAEYEAYIDEQMSNEEILNAAIQYGRINRKAKRKSRESRTTADGEVAPQLITNAYGARMITKAGLTMISPGEAIIPANINPWNPNKDKVNLNAQLANEKSLKNKFLNSIGNKIGLNTKGNDGYGNTLADSEPLGKQAIKTAASGVGEVFNRMILGDDKEAKAFKDATDEIKSKVKDYLPTMAATGLIGGGVGLLTGIGGPILGAVAGAGLGLLQKSDKLQDWLFGKMGEDGERENNGVISKDMQKSVQKYLPDLKKFGIAGALTGLFTPLGPIGGLMVGSAITYVKNNEKFANLLYGDVVGQDENGKDIRDGGIFGKSHMDKLKKAAPNILGGAALGVLAGPFGLVGNIALGSAVGLATSTEGFKTAIFGEEGEDGKRTGGIVGAFHESFVEPLKEFGKGIKENFDNFIKQDILQPLAGAIQPLATELSDAIKKAVMFIPNIFTKFMENKITAPLANWMQEKIFNPLGKATKFLLSAPIKLAKTVVSAPFKAVGAVGNMFRQKQIMQGRASYMSADERLNWRSQHKVRGVLAKFKIPGAAGLAHSDRFLETDQAIAEMDANTVKDVRDALAVLRTGKGDIDSKLKGIKKKIWNEVNKYFNDNDKVLFIHKGTRKKILDAIAKEKFAEVRHLIQTAKGKNGRPIPNEEREELLNNIIPLLDEYTETKNRQKTFARKSKGELTDIIQKAGIKNFNVKDAAKFESLFNSEVKARESRGEYDKVDSGEGIGSEALETQTTRVVDELVLIKEYMKMIATGTGEEGLDGRAIAKSRLAKHGGKRADKKIKKAVDAKAAENLLALKKIYGKTPFYNEDGSEKKDIINAVKGNEDGVNFLLSKRSDGSQIKVGNLTDVLTIAQKDNKAFVRLQECSEYMDLSDKSVKIIKKLSDTEYAQFRQALKMGIDPLDDNGDLDEAYVKSLSKGTAYKHYNEGATKSRGIKKFARETGNAFRDIRNAFTGTVSKSFNEYNAFFNKMGLVGSKASSIATPSQFEWLYKNQRHRLDKVMKSNNPEVEFKKLVDKFKDQISIPTFASEGEAIINGINDETETNAFGRLGAALKATKDTFKARSMSISSSDASDSKEAHDAAIKEQAEAERQNSIASGITSIADLIIDWRNNYDKNLEDEDKGKSGFWSKIKGLAAGTLKVAGGIAGGAFAAGIYKNYVQPQIANIFTDFVKPWWTESAIPALKNSTLGQSIIKGFDYITGQGEYAESGGLRGTVTGMVDWFLGRGKYDGNGLPDMAKNVFKTGFSTVKDFTMDFIIPNMFTGFEWVLGDVAPAIVRGFFINFPKLLGGLLRGIKNIFTNNDKGTTESISELINAGKEAEKVKSGGVATKADASILSRWGLVKPSTENVSYVSQISSMTGLNETKVNEAVSKGTNAAATTYNPNDITVDEDGYVINNERGLGYKGVEYVARSAARRNYLNVLSPLKVLSSKGAIGKGINKTADVIKRIPKIGKITNLGLKFGTKTADVLSDVGTTAGTVAEAIGEGKVGEMLGNTTIGKGVNKLTELFRNSKLGQGVSNIVSNVKNTISNSKIGKLASGVADSKLGKAIAKVSDFANSKGGKLLLGVSKEQSEGLTDKIAKKVMGFLEDKLGKLFKSNKVVDMFVKSMKEAGEKATKELAEKAAEKAGKKIIKALGESMIKGLGKATAKVITKASAAIASGGLLNLAFLVVDFVAGMAKAENILGVTDNVSFTERLVCGIVNVITETFTLGLVDASVVVDLVIDHLLPAIGLDSSKLKERRNAAEVELAAWNAEHPDEKYDSVEDYNDRNKWTLAKGWNKVTSFFSGKGSDKEDKKLMSKGVGSSASYGTGTVAKKKLGGIYGMGSGNHFYQTDSRYANIPFNASGDTVKQTMGDSGCGPIAAAQVIQRYAGNGVDPINAAKYAISGGYKEVNGGTIPTFFRDYLAENSINTELLTDIKSTVNKIGGGQPVILMGTDRANSTSTPYGRSPHYVVATGFDRKGNIIIQNPESPTPDSVYNASEVLSKSSLAIGTSYNTAKFGKGTGYNKFLTRIPRYGRAANAHVVAIAYDGGGGSSSDYIGKHVKKFESSTQGSLALGHSGNDFGLSCGSYQMTLRWGTCISFLKKYFPEAAKNLYYNSFKDFESKSWPGYEYCSSPDAVKAVWKACYNAVGPDTFFSYEWEFIRDRYYDKACTDLSDIFNPNMHSRAMQECIWSWSVHKGHSGCNKGFREAIAAAGITDPQTCSEAKLLKACYDYRHNQMIKSYPNNTRYSAVSGQERDTVSKLIDRKPIDYKGHSLGTSTAIKSTKDEKELLMNKDAIGANNFSTKMGSIFSQIDAIVKNTKLYQLYQDIFGSPDEEEKEKEEPRDIAEPSNAEISLNGPITETYVQNYQDKKIEEQIKNDGIKKVDFTNPLSKNFALDNAYNMKKFEELGVIEPATTAATRTTGSRAMDSGVSRSRASVSPAQQVADIKKDLINRGIIDVHGTVKYCNRKLSTDNDYLNFYKNFTIGKVGSVEFGYPKNADSIYINRLKSDVAHATHAGKGTGKINSAIRGIIKGGSGTGSTSSTAVANLNKSVSGYKLTAPTINTPKVTINRSISGSSGTRSVNYSIDYSMILTAMVEILSTIADNTSAIQKIVDLLSEKLDIDTSSINTKTDSAKKIRARLQSKLQEMSEYNRMNSAANDADTIALVNAMAAIARG